MKSPGLDALRRFEKETLDDCIILEKLKVTLYIALVLVGK